MTDMIFEPFQKIARLNRDCTITEKIDGTNTQIIFDEEGNFLVGSRKRRIFPNGTLTTDKGKPDNSTDNFGFARWAYDNHRDLFNYLGPGRHYGEWAGQGIQRGYGLKTRRWYLFNTSRHQDIPVPLKEIGVDIVPVLYDGPFTTFAVDGAMELLAFEGSHIAKYDNPEGVVIFHHARGYYFKVTFEHDEGKWKGT